MVSQGIADIKFNSDAFLFIIEGWESRFNKVDTDFGSQPLKLLMKLLGFLAY